MFAQLVADKINNNGHVDAADVAKMLTEAAIETLEYAAGGHQITDDLTREQAGAVIAAVSWNYNRKMRKAVKIKRGR